MESPVIFTEYALQARVMANKLTAMPWGCPSSWTTVRAALDVAHYGLLESAPAAMRRNSSRKAINSATHCTDPDWSGAICRRIVNIEVTDGNVIAADLPLDDFVLRRVSGHEGQLSDSAPALLAALEKLIGRADEVIAAMEGCTDAFDAEAGALYVRAAPC